MYETFFGFRERPFDLAPDPRFLVLTDAHAEALSTLEYGISSRKPITLLIGDAGVGKTTLIRAALDRLPERVRCIHLQNPVLSRPEFIEMLARRFNLSPQAATSKTAFLCELEEFLGQARAQGETIVLVIDEAQSLPSELLEEIRLLANLDTHTDRLLSVILAGQPELAERLNDPSLRQFKQRIALRCAIPPLTAQETERCIAGRLRAAGASDADSFTREAIVEIHRRSGGIPRTISVIADNALLGGFARGVRPVPASIVREVCADMHLTTATRPQPVPPLLPRMAVMQPEPAHAGGGAARTLFASFMKRRRFGFFSS